LCSRRQKENVKTGAGGKSARHFLEKVPSPSPQTSGESKNILYIGKTANMQAKPPAVEHLAISETWRRTSNYEREAVTKRERRENQSMNKARSN